MPQMETIILRTVQEATQWIRARDADATIREYFFDTRLAKDVNGHYIEPCRMEWLNGLKPRYPETLPWTINQPVGSSVRAFDLLNPISLISDLITLRTKPW